MFLQKNFLIFKNAVLVQLVCCYWEEVLLFIFTNANRLTSENK